MIVGRFLTKKRLVIVCVCMIVLLISKKQEFSENEIMRAGEDRKKSDLDQKSILAEKYLIDLAHRNDSRSRSIIYPEDSEVHTSICSDSMSAHIINYYLDHATPADISSKGMLTESSNGSQPIKVCMNKTGCM